MKKNKSQVLQSWRLKFNLKRTHYSDNLLNISEIDTVNNAVEGSNEILSRGDLA